MKGGRPAPLAALTFPARSRAAAADSRVFCETSVWIIKARRQPPGCEQGEAAGDSRAVKQRSKLGTPRPKRLGRAGAAGLRATAPIMWGSPGVRAGELAAV